MTADAVITAATADAVTTAAPTAAAVTTARDGRCELNWF